MAERGIKPSDIVLHKPSGEEWVVCGVNEELGKLIPCGWPFPSIANINDCELLEKRYEAEGQSEEYINALRGAGYPSFVVGNGGRRE